jgi:glycosyltransferase involved in cell wall biosynthesis
MRQALEGGSQRLKCLMIVATNPYPPVSGGQRRTLSELETYSRFMDIDLLAFHDVTQPQVPDQMKKHLAHLCRSVGSVPISLLYTRHRGRLAFTLLRSQLTGRPYRVMKFINKEMENILKTKMSNSKYDIIHFNHLASTAYLPMLLQYEALRLCTEANVEWEIFARYAETLQNPLKRLLAQREALRLREYEIRTLNQMDGVIALSERDKEILQRDGVKAPIHIFRRPLTVSQPPIVRWETSEPMVISLGRLEETRTHGTLWCAREVWHRVREHVPDARWHIIGLDPPHSVQALHGRDGIAVEGFVEDLTPFLQRARACIIPLFIGGGIRIKILDMLSVGLPCVSTTVGAQGLENEGVWIADDPEGFAQGIVEVLTNRNRWEAMQRAGQAFIQANYATEAVVAETQAFIQSLLERKNARNSARP